MNSEFEFRDIELAGDQRLAPAGRLTLMFTSPAPGIEIVGITFTDRLSGSKYTLGISPEQAELLADDLALALDNLGAARLEDAIRREDTAE